MIADKIAIGAVSVVLLVGAIILVVDTLTALARGWRWVRGQDRTIK